MSRPRLLFLVPLLALLPLDFVQAAPKDDAAWCGTGTAQQVISAAKHLQFQRRLERRRLVRHARGELAFATQASRVYRSGRVAVIEGDDRIVAGPNPFDLPDQGIQFLRRAAGYRTQRWPRPMFTAIGERLDLDDEGNVAVDFPGWEFPFHGRSWARVFVNANGNLTFGEPSDTWHTDLSVFVAGPPRIAALFVDLDPGEAGGDGGVFVRVFPNRLRVTWLRVPQWGRSDQSSAQVTLHRNGRIQILFGEVEAGQAIVGITPGGGDPRLELLDFDVDLPYPTIDGAIAEHFRFQHEYDEFGVARTFYEHFEDVHDFMIIWLDFPHALMGGAANAYYSEIRNTTQGIGRRMLDDSDLVGSDGRLQGLVNMGTMDIYPDDPDEVFRHIHTPMSLLSHEFAHRWLASVDFLDQAGNASSALRSGSHWTFYFDSDASVMLGNEIVDNGDGTFLTVGGPRRYGDLDLYLMGMLPAEEVPDFFYVANVADPTPNRKPEGGVTLIGDRVDVGIDQVIAVEGPRIPTSVESQKHFKVAFVLLTADGEAPRPQSLARIQRFRRRWMTYVPEISRGLATVATAVHER